MKAATAKKQPETEMSEEDIYLSNRDTERLDKDLRAAAKIMSADEARYLVSSYYAMQDMRKRFENQERAMEAAGQPHELVSWMARNAKRMEKYIQVSLDVYTANDRVGQWLRANKGIGPVIAAGLTAHVDINKSPTVGHIWRYAGLDATMKWYGKGIADVIRAARVAENDDWDALVWLGRSIHMRPSAILVNAGLLDEDAVVSVDDALAHLTRRAGHRLETKAIFHSDNAVKELVPQTEQGKVFKELYPKTRIKWEPITKALAKRPWNSELKTLCWKIGESFKKVSNEVNGRKPSPYGIMYRERKMEEIAKNEAGRHVEAAADILAKKKLGKSTDAYFWYSGEWVNNPRLNVVLGAEFEAEKGRRAGELEKRLKAKKKDELASAVEQAWEEEVLADCIKAADRPLTPRLPPAHVDARASRFAVKLFLSHFHEAAYKRVLGKMPPNPYPIEHMGHIHKIAPFVRDDDISIAEEIEAL